MIKRFFLTIFIVFLGAGLLATGFLVWGYYYVTRDLPNLSRIEDYQPPAVTKVLSSDGTLIAEFYIERRYPVKLKDVPDLVKRAFLAAEDASFYDHQGVDPAGIARAILKNFQSGNVKQGGSTITQQVVKNLLLNPERKYTRKVKEAILAYRLEKRFSKDDILEIYLNQIFLGNGAYGILAASRIYFHKELADLTLAEVSLLAGLPQAPSDYSPISHYALAKKRRQYVLQQMVKAGFITAAQMDKTNKEEVTVYPAGQQNVFGAPYFVREVRRIFGDRWRGLDLDRDGLEIRTTVDLRADALSLNALRTGLREVDKRRGWRGPIAHIEGGLDAYLKKYAASFPEELELGNPYPGLILSVGSDRLPAKIAVGNRTVDVLLNESAWAKRFLRSDDTAVGGRPTDLLRAGDLVEISRRIKGEGEAAEEFFALDQTPDIEGAMVLIDPHTGAVRAMTGGYDYSQSQFNRVTQSLRQPGSAFKPVIYLTALDKYRYTPSTIVQDAPRTFRVGDTFWTPANFDEKFLGPITLRTALEKSRNLVSADIVSRIGVDAPIEYARALGISSPLGRNLSLSLGSSEVTLLEMSRAYGVLSNQGILLDSQFIETVKDRFGNVVFDFNAEREKSAHQAIDAGSSFIMTHMMTGVIQYGTGYKAKELGRPVAGKTGTSNDQMDAWFIGYTPAWTCGVWVGFDQKKQIGAKETGGVVSAPIWLRFMQNFLKYSEAIEKEKLEKEAKEESERLAIAFQPPEYKPLLDFPVPESVDPFWVDKGSGTLTSPGTSGAIIEYFKKGTEPPTYVESEETEQEEAESYLESPDL